MVCDTLVLPHGILMSVLSGSDLIHLNLLGTHVVVLNTAQAAVELLERRSLKYSDRCTFSYFNLLLDNLPCSLQPLADNGR
jgi:hypothetical protein